MEINEFVVNFAAQFDETDISEFSPSTEFRQLEEWSSLTVLSIIAMVDEIYKVKITGIDIKSLKTINDIYQFVLEKK